MKIHRTEHETLTPEETIEALDLTEDEVMIFLRHESEEMIEFERILTEREIYNMMKEL